MSRALAILALSTACQPEGALRALEAIEDRWLQARTNDTDVLWVIDNSGSMASEHDLLADGFGRFAQQLERGNTDFHLGVITTTVDEERWFAGVLVGQPAFLTRSDAFAALFQKRTISDVYRVPISGFEQGLAAAVRAVGPPLTDAGGPNAGFIRDTATLQIVFVSDEDDCSHGGAIDERFESPTTCTHADRLVPVEELVGEIQAHKPNPDFLQLSAIVGLDGSKCSATPGRRYIEAARLTGGVTGDLCQADWGSTLQDLGLATIGRRRVFRLRTEPRPSTLQVFLDNEPVPSATPGWGYDPVLVAIVFDEAATPPPGTRIRATYQAQE